MFKELNTKYKKSEVFIPFSLNIVHKAQLARDTTIKGILMLYSIL